MLSDTKQIKMEAERKIEKILNDLESEHNFRAFRIELDAHLDEPIEVNIIRDKRVGGTY